MKDKKITAVIYEYIVIALGTCILALGINMFLLPSRLSSGGISSIGTVLLYLFNIPLSVTNIIFNVILFAFGYKYLGRASLIKTVVGIVFFSIFLEITGYFPVYSGDILIATLAGGVLMGIGLGMVIRTDASTGGSDFAGLILHKFVPHISVASFIMVIDCIIIVVAGAVFGSITVTFYSAIALFVMARVTDAMLEVGDAAKNVYVLSAKYEEIATTVIDAMHRGVTGMCCKGMYSKKEGLMLLCVVSPKELPRLINIIKETDREAFIIVNDVKEVLGEGFKAIR